MSQLWKLEKRDQVKEIWQLPGSGGVLRARIMLPLDHEFADFRARFCDALYAIGRVSGWGAQELEERVLMARADLFFVRLDQVRADDTIPLKQAEGTLDALYKMLRAAAVTTADPSRVGRGGRLPSIVTDFLDEDVQLGHTKRGSFVFTLISYLDGGSERAQEVMPTVQGPLERVAPFPRRVMETLARGLETTRDLAEGRSGTALEDPVRWGLGAGLVESVGEMIGSEGLRSLELSFAWATAEPRPDVGSEPITLEHAQAGELERARERLLRREEPSHRETLVGRVKSLARDDDAVEDEQAGSIVVSAEVNGRRRNVHMVLAGQDHENAILAYGSQQPFIVSGDLYYERGAWRLGGDLEVDASLVHRRPGTAEGPSDGAAQE
jgi:hypothetical protein